MMTTEKKIVRADELVDGDIVEMPLDGTVRITYAAKGRTYGGTPCMHVRGDGPDGTRVDIDFAFGSTFHVVSLKADRLREEIADLDHIVETTNDENVARMAADARDQLIGELEDL